MIVFNNLKIIDIHQLFIINIYVIDHS